MSLALIDRVKTNQVPFERKVIDVAGKLGIPPDWLMSVMYFESGLNHRAVNTSTGATGLIQFMPKTAISLGTTVAKLLGMSNVEQMDYVYKYLLPYKSKFKAYHDVYLTVFFPAAVGMPEDTIIQTKNLKPDTIAKANPIFDLDHNGQITIAEIKAALYKKAPAALQQALAVAKKGLPVVGVAAVLLLLFFISR